MMPLTVHSYFAGSEYTVLMAIFTINTADFLDLSWSTQVSQCIKMKEVESCRIIPSLGLENSNLKGPAEKILME